MQRQLIWQTLPEPALEHFEITSRPSGYEATGVVVGLDSGEPFRLHYRLQIDSSWCVRVLDAVNMLTDATLSLRSDGQGRWTDAAGTHLASLDGCTDIDITVTPFTNTLPIRRLSPATRESADIEVVYIQAVSLTAERQRQRYTLLERAALRSLYRYQAGDFTAEIDVDSDGLVVRYGDIFTRIWNG